MLRIRWSGHTTGKASRAMSLTRLMALPVALLGALTVAVVLASAVDAVAISGTPVNVGTPFESGPPAVAVDAAGTAYVAWANTKDLAPTTTNVVQYCVLPIGAVACTHSGTLVPADEAQFVDGVQVLVDGSTVVVLADVYGAEGAGGLEYEPEQEWQSTDGGATFNIANAGKSVASGHLSADTQPLNAVIVPGTGVLGFGWDSAAGNETYGAVPTFDAFPLASPPQCSRKNCQPAEAFAVLEPNSNPDPIRNEAGQFASQQGTSSGVLGIFKTDYTNGPLGCSSAVTVPFGTAFAFGSGPQSAGNDYNVSPGSPNSAWKVPVAQADCNVDYAAVGGGPSGFGVVEDNELTKTTIYHRFNQATNSFDTPMVTIAGESEQQSSVSQDGAGGVYATFLGEGAGGPIDLAYSFDGGTTWAGPNALNVNADLGAGDLTSSVGPAGHGWAVWTDNGSVYAQPFVATDAVAAAAPDMVTTTQTSGATTGVSLAIPAGTTGETDRATINGVNAGFATGTVTYGLYSSSSCTPPSKVFDGGTTAVSGGVAAPSAGVSVALAPGTYYWQASYSGNEGSIQGTRGNVANASACGSEVLSIGAVASGVYTIKSITSNSDGTITFVLVPAQSGEAELVVTVPTASIAGSGAAAKAKKCKKGQVKLKGKCLPVKTVVGRASAHGTAGVPLKLTVHLSSKIKALLKKGKTVHLMATFGYRSSLGGAATVNTYKVTVKGHRPKKKKK
jgi:hypothetical protein